MIILLVKETPGQFINRRRRQLEKKHNQTEERPKGYLAVIIPINRPRRIKA